MTNSKKIYGENRLFATLDTTIHPVTLPSCINVLLADTIGFIADLPIKLFASFSATLRHIENADILIHIQDLSHPNLLAHRDNVLNTLKQLGINPSLIDSMISVGNKIDTTTPKQKEMLILEGRVSPEGTSSESMIVISCRTGQGMSELLERVDKSVQQITGSRPRCLRLSPGSKSLSYLYEQNLVSVPPKPSECGNYLFFDVVMNDAQMATLQAHGTKLKRIEKIQINENLVGS